MLDVPVLVLAPTIPSEYRTKDSIGEVGYFDMVDIALEGVGLTLEGVDRNGCGLSSCLPRLMPFLLHAALDASPALWLQNLSFR